MNPGFARQVIHAESMTVARVYLQKGYRVPEHRHVNEQLSLIEKGRLRFEIGGREIDVGPGEAFQIPSNVPHAALALEDTEGVDIFTPVRED